ncbi:MAG: ATP-binding domain-containing protein, partial [Desulfobacterales bacterium]|nr:ATP-binding domain-containing protein [Desulfobacterales bacterium]
YRILDSKGFFERREILDITCYLLASVFPKDDTALERIINVPRRGIGPAMVKKINDLKEDNMSMQDAVRKGLSDKAFSGKIEKGLSELIKLLDDIKSLTPDEAIHMIFKKTGYMDYLKDDISTDAVDFTSRQENLEQLIYAASQKETIREYLEEAALVKEDTEEDDEKKKKGVNLLTIHGSKGLEYTAVFIIGCEEQLFPHWRSMNSDREIEEERRLMYVAITRAEQYLFLTSADFRKGRFNPPSRFIDEIKAACTKSKPTLKKRRQI